MRPGSQNDGIATIKEVDKRDRFGKGEEEFFKSEGNYG